MSHIGSLTVNIEYIGTFWDAAWYHLLGALGFRSQASKHLQSKIKILPVRDADGKLMSALVSTSKPCAFIHTTDIETPHPRLVPFFKETAKALETGRDITTASVEAEGAKNDND